MPVFQQQQELYLSFDISATTYMLSRGYKVNHLPSFSAMHEDLIRPVNCLYFLKTS